MTLRMTGMNWLPAGMNWLPPRPASVKEEPSLFSPASPMILPPFSILFHCLLYKSHFWECLLEACQRTVVTAGTSGYCQRTKLVHCADGDAQAEKSTSPGKKEAHLEGRCWRDMGLVERDPDMSSDRQGTASSSFQRPLCLPSCLWWLLPREMCVWGLGPLFFILITAHSRGGAKFVLTRIVQQLKRKLFQQRGRRNWVLLFSFSATTWCELLSNHLLSKS